MMYITTVTNYYPLVLILNCFCMVMKQIYTVYAHLSLIQFKDVFAVNSGAYFFMKNVFFVYWNSHFEDKKVLNRSYLSSGNSHVGEWLKSVLGERLPECNFRAPFQYWIRSHIIRSHTVWNLWGWVLKCSYCFEFGRCLIAVTFWDLMLRCLGRYWNGHQGPISI